MFLSHQDIEQVKLTSLLQKSVEAVRCKNMTYYGSNQLLLELVQVSVFLIFTFLVIIHGKRRKLNSLQIKFFNIHLRIVLKNYYLGLLAQQELKLIPYGGY